MESDIYWVDTRNADSRDHRTGGGVARRGARALARRGRWWPSRRDPSRAGDNVLLEPYGNRVHEPVREPVHDPPQGTLASNCSQRSRAVSSWTSRIFARADAASGGTGRGGYVGTDVGNLILYQNARVVRGVARRFGRSATSSPSCWGSASWRLQLQGQGQPGASSGGWLRSPDRRRSGVRRCGAADRSRRTPLDRRRATSRRRSRRRRRIRRRARRIRTRAGLRSSRS